MSFFSPAIVLTFLYTTVVFFFPLPWGGGFAAVAYGQEPPPNRPSAVRCPSPANPHKLYRECAGQPFDVIEHTLTADWVGLRSELQRLGITPTASYTTQLMGNPSGGQEQGFTYAGTVQATVFWDLDPLIHLPGLAFSVGGAWSTGHNLAVDDVGSIFTIQSAYTAPNNGANNLTLGEMYVQQQLWNNTLVVAAGRLAPQGTFATMPVLNQYINGGINPVPGHLGINDSTFTQYPPGVEWGVQALYNLTPRWQVAAGVFNTNQIAAHGGKGGLEFALQQGNRGALSVVQVNYLVNHAPHETGLPGQYTLGGFYDSNRFPSLSNPNATESGTYSLYGLFQQMLYRDGGADSQQGLTVWGETSIAPKASVNTMPYFLGAGVSYQGLMPGRSNDIVSAGFIYGIFSHYIPHTTAETVLEANYQITVKRWFSITPDMQYIIRPSGSSAIGNAFVLGTQLVVHF
jgi:porin